MKYLLRKITCTDIYYELQRLYSDDLSHHKFTATVSYRMYVTETISLREFCVTDCSL
jgi:hypothetical protein